jgi:hypothetical protein
MSVHDYLDRIERVLIWVLRVLLVASLIGVLGIGVPMLRNMSASERSQGGAFYVGAAMAIIVAVIVGQLLVTLRRTGRSRR